MVGSAGFWGTSEVGKGTSILFNLISTSSLSSLASTSNSSGLIGTSSLSSLILRVFSDQK